MPAADDHTHFGFDSVSRDEKTRRVRGVFDSVAAQYDCMNDCMSLGLHRLWKDFAVARLGVCANDQVLDLAGGTGDLTIRIDRLLSNKGRVWVVDINAAMLAHGRDRLLNAGVHRPRFVQSNGEQLPFADATFDIAVCAFGVRNMTNPTTALQEMHRVLKPGGRVAILEFSTPTSPLLHRLYDAYSFTALPLLGKIIAGNADAYRYLAESIRRHPDQLAFADWLRTSGFAAVQYDNLCGGIVALHTGLAA